MVKIPRLFVVEHLVDFWLLMSGLFAGSRLLFAAGAVLVAYDIGALIRVAYVRDELLRFGALPRLLELSPKTPWSCRSRLR